MMHRIKLAKAHRDRLFESEETTVYRILNGAGDGVPGLFVDRYGDWAVSAEPRVADERARLEAYEALMEVWGFRGLYEKGRASASGFHPGQSPPDTPVLGEEAPEEFPVLENGMSLLARLREGARTGVYPDQRENRSELRPFLEGARVLNMFSYTGAFSVWAAMCGALETVSVDLSRRVLDWSQRNFAANGIDSAGHRHVKADAFDYLGLARRKGFRFNLVILDPPSFSTSRRGLFQAKRDWPRLIDAAIKVLEQGGRLAISCNTHQISRREILSMVAAGIGGKRSRIVKPEWVQGLPPDFTPSGAAGAPESDKETDTLQFILTKPIKFKNQ